MRALRMIAAAVLVCAPVAACGRDNAAAIHAPATSDTARPGHLVSKDKVDAGLGVPTYRVRYTSTSVGGDAIEVSGLIAVPKGASSRTPVVSWAHGATGIADRCAPSNDPGAAIGWLRPLVEKGWVIAATDYEGLGTPGRHPFINGTSEGRSTLDIVRAAGDLAGADLGPVVVAGLSEGGHAALWAGQLAASWAPDLDVVGVVSGAPATELPLIAKALQNGPAQGFIPLGVAGLNAAEPERADMSLVLSKATLDALDIVDRECVPAVLQTFAGIPYADLVTDDVGEVEPWRSILLENDPGHTKTDIPIYLFQGENDELIPLAASQLLFERLCSLGQVVERHTYPGQSHAGVIAVAFGAFSDWMEARVVGRPVATGCSDPR